MSRWTERLESFEIDKTIEELRTCLEIEPEGIVAELETEKRRLIKVLLLIENFVNIQDKEAYWEQAIQSISTVLKDQVVRHVKSYSIDPQIIHLTNANDAISSLTQYTYQNQDAISADQKIISSAVEGTFDSITRKMQKAHEELTVKHERQQSDIGELTRQIDDLKNQYETLRNQTMNSFTTWKSSFSDAQLKRNEDFSDQKIMIEKDIADKINSWDSEAQKNIKDVLVKHTDQLEQEHREYVRVANAFREEMERMRAEVQEVHGLFGSDAVAGGYQRTAKDEHKAANVWRRISMISLAFAAAWIAVKYYLQFGNSQSAEINWPELATAASLTLVLLGAGGYAARQSRQHRDAYRQMQWFALEVNALDPFISSLPEAERYALKNQLAQKLFGRNHSISDSADDAIGPAHVGIFERLINLVNK